MPFTPPRWVNRLTALVLHTPGLQRLVGRATALITFTGRTSGATYTTPVTYVRRNGTILLTCHESRRWWRNLADRPRVRLRVAGKQVNGTALIHHNDDEAPAYLRAFAEGRPSTARAWGLARDETGRLDERALRDRLVDTVVVEVSLDRPESDGSGAAG